MRSQSSFTRIFVVCFLIVIALIPDRAVSSEGRRNLSDCDGERLKDLKSLPEGCRHCVPLVVDGVPRCLPYFMPGDIKSAEPIPHTACYSVTLAKNVSLQGFAWPAGTRLTTSVFGGDFGTVEFPTETEVKGFAVKVLWLWSFESVHIDSLELQVDQLYEGYLWPKGSVLYFHYDSKEKPKLWYVKLGLDSLFDGKKYKKRDYLWFNKDGKIDLTAPKPKPLY